MENGRGTTTPGRMGAVSAAGPVAGAVVLLVEPDAGAAERLIELLKERSVAVCVAATGADAKEMAANLGPDLIVMELALPDADGLVVCADLRMRVGAPIIVYTNRDSRERVLSLRLGADDAVAKPADEDELMARIEVALRRARSGRASMRARTVGGPAVTPLSTASVQVQDESGERFQRIDDVEIDRLLGRVTIAGRLLYLSAPEYRLLSLFMSRPGDVLSREELSELVFGVAHVPGSRSIDMHIRRLRAKLEGVQGAVPVLPVVRGHGYRLVPRYTSARHEHVSAA